MQPAIRAGDWLLVDPTVARWPRRGSVVVFREPDGERLAVKRVVAGPGDRVPFSDGFLEPEEVATRMAEVRVRCETEGRDPATLRFSLYLKDEQVRFAGQARVDILGQFEEIGLDRIVCFPTRWSPTLDAQAAFAEDCRAAGMTLDAAAVGATT